MEGVLLYLDGTEFFYFCKGGLFRCESWACLWGDLAWIIGLRGLYTTVIHGVFLKTEELWIGIVGESNIKLPDFSTRSEFPLLSSPIVLPYIH